MEYKKTIGQTLEALLLEARPNATLFNQYRAPGRPAFSVRNDALLNSLIEFETNLAEASPDPEDAQDITKSYNPFSLAGTRALLPQVSIPYLISQRSPNYMPDKIIVGSPAYLKAVSQILVTTDKATIQAYLVWKTVQAYGVNIESDALKPLKRFNNRLRGKEPEVTEERWRFCVKHVDNGLGQLFVPIYNDRTLIEEGWLLSRSYVEKAFSEEAKYFGDAIVSNIKEQFIKKLDASEWMSKDVRQLAIDKGMMPAVAGDPSNSPSADLPSTVYNIVQKIGFPTESPDIRDPSMLQKYYKPVTISKTAFFQNTVSIARADVEREWSKAGKETDREAWGMTASTVNVGPRTQA